MQPLLSTVARGRSRQNHARPAKTAPRRKKSGPPRYFSTQISAAQRFFLDLNPAPGPGIAVVSGGCEHCRGDYQIRRHTFPFTTVEFVSGGAGKLWLAGREYVLSPGTVFLYGRHTPHRITSDPQDALVKYFVAFGGGDAEALMRECQLCAGKVVRVPDPKQIQAVLDDLVRHGRSDHADRGRMCSVALQYLLMKIGDVALPYGNSARGAYVTYCQCRRYLEQHYAEIRSVREAAEACHVDLSYLCRLFQRFGRERPNRYLQHLRLNWAAELLHAGRPIKDVAAALGFTDSFSFSRAFRHSFGLPPGRFQAGSA
jgi:AraC-like DNA-binding protein